MKGTLLLNHRGFIVALCLLAFAGLVILACSSGSSSPTEPVADTTDSGSGSSDSGGSDDSGGTTDTEVTEGVLQISMTDAATEEICQLVVFIEDLRVKKDGSPPEILGAVGMAYDLMQLQNGEQVLLGDFEVEQGLYQFIEMLLDESKSYVVEKLIPDDPDITTNCKDPIDDQEPLKIPSEKFKINGGPFEVDEMTEVLIDFDAKNSLKTTGNGKTYQLNPDVSIAEAN